MEQAGAINGYKCEQCSHVTFTINEVDGTTPFMIKCRRNNIGCADRAMAQSLFYRVPQDSRPDWEWYRPEGEAFEKLDDWSKDHVNAGGLLLRKLDAAGREKYGFNTRAG